MQMVGAVDAARTTNWKSQIAAYVVGSCNAKFAKTSWDTPRINHLTFEWIVDMRPHSRRLYWGLWILYYLPYLIWQTCSENVPIIGTSGKGMVFVVPRSNSNEATTVNDYAVLVCATEVDIVISVEWYEFLWGDWILKPLCTASLQRDWIIDFLPHLTGFD